ncbi:MAG: C39 family peptidase [Pseudomonadota bacterium]|nr:C39 family peptidase [Pseudomonadota bacterium]
MLVVTLGSALIYYFSTQSLEVASQPGGTVFYSEVTDSRHNSFTRYHQPPVQVKPLVEGRFRGIVRQQYDYSCGSAALTTLLNGYLGTTLGEREILDGMLRYGEYDRIIERRSFSLLDMKRYVTALGYDSGGFRGEFEDLIGLDKPAVVPIAYAGFKHFVVYKGYRDGRVFVADPALGHLSFSASQFQQIWDNNTLFVIMPTATTPINDRLTTLEDHHMRFVEDHQINQFALVDMIEFPTRRFEQLADRAGTMQRVRDADPNSDTHDQLIDTSLRLYYSRK